MKKIYLIYLLIKYFFLLFTFQRILIELKSGTIYNISPEAVQELKMSDGRLEFCCTISGIRNYVAVSLNDIIWLGSD